MPLFKHLPLAAPALLLGASLRADPPAQTATPHFRRPPTGLKDLVPSGPQIYALGRRGPGDIIPPCFLSYGYTSQGPTDRDGHLLTGRAQSVPRWADVSAARRTPRR